MRPVVQKRERERRIMHAAAKLKALDPSLSRHLLEMVARKSPPSSRGYAGKTQKDRKEEKRLAHAEETAGIRAAVWNRSGDKCESCYGFLGPGQNGVLDHWLGGTGRRRQKQALETCWRLCLPCDTRRTSNFPSAAYWNDEFKHLCERYGYPFTPHKGAAHAAKEAK